VKISRFKGSGNFKCNHFYFFPLFVFAVYYNQDRLSVEYSISDKGFYFGWLKLVYYINLLED